MSAKTVTSFRLDTDLIEQLNQKCPYANRSLMMNNLLRYLLSQDQELIQEFTKKVS